jgi:2-(1,2-epoxy-1,2-dihydrophenyl)acetyl-CoA isomerase
MIWLNRPAKRNAIDMELRVLLAEQLELAMLDQSVRVIVLTGAGGTFSSGGDVSTMQRTGPEQAAPRAEATQRVVRAIWSGAKPVIAAVEGAAYGAGLSLAIACDLVVAAEDARFSTAFMGVGLAGDMGVFGSLPARVGRQLAKRLMLVPRVLSGTEAGDLGLVDQVVGSGVAFDTALELADSIGAAPPLAIAAMKRLLGVPISLLDREAAEQVVLFDTEDFGEGAAAFATKRKPTFRGR